MNGLKDEFFSESCGVRRSAGERGGGYCAISNFCCEEGPENVCNVQVAMVATLVDGNTLFDSRVLLE
ncbi:hypothetical protein NPIL_332911 [Nephila pilipes]|uniref:Uncharacterized protein n=1 Tax=Nephila pilipes TaxID=299642 RepID=A0A8X6PIJ0_NEPPI|nr:hypothetical protein NPIL_332911 [Nephila pilipes]